MTRDIAFFDGSSSPVNNLSCQNFRDLQFLANGQQQKVYASGINVAQFGNVTDAHHHFRFRPTLSCLDVALDAGGKTKADGFKDRIDSNWHIVASQEIDGRIHRSDVLNVVWNYDDFAAPVDRSFVIRLIDGQNQFGPGGNGRFNFVRV